MTTRDGGNDQQLHAHLTAQQADNPNQDSGNSPPRLTDPALSTSPKTPKNQQGALAPPTPDTSINASQYVALPESPTFESLRVDSRILTLYRAILGVKDNGHALSFCANALWYGWGDADEQPFSFKEDLCQIVGFAMPGEQRAHPFLATSEAYEMVYRKLYAALPPCRNCSCSAFEHFAARIESEGGSHVADNN